MQESYHWEFVYRTRRKSKWSWDSPNTPVGTALPALPWQPKGLARAHLHEHRLRKSQLKPLGSRLNLNQSALHEYEFLSRNARRPRGAAKSVALALDGVGAERRRAASKARARAVVAALGLWQRRDTSLWRAAAHAGRTQHGLGLWCCCRGRRARAPGRARRAAGRPAS
eukprot:COSAG02_NODE_29782_length_563_cov_0.799569_1_plen_168_part_01